MVINLRQNKSDDSSAFGKYFAEVDAKEPLNLKGLAKHMVEHNKVSTYEMTACTWGLERCVSNIVLNSDHPLVKKVLDDSEAATAEALKPIVAELKGQEARLAAIRQAQDKKKYDELTQEDKDHFFAIFLMVS